MNMHAVSDSQPIERELKLCLSSFEDYSALQNLFGTSPAEVLQQSNVYFDSADAYFACKRSMLRLRTENGRRLFVYKRGISLQEGYFSALEIETEISEAQAESLLSGSADSVKDTEAWIQAEHDGFKGIICPVGFINNKRLVWPVNVLGFDGKEKFELDCITFPDGHIEYELELETCRPDFFLEKLLPVMSASGIKFYTQKQTKYERFINCIILEKPVISCIMPVYNCAATLKNAVLSIQKQTFKRWELIIADDGSSDESYEICQKLAAEDARIKVIKAEHGGIVKALNLGLREARADFIARMDGDDISHPRRFAEQLLFMHDNPDIDAVGCRIKIFPSKGLTDGMRRYERWLNSSCEASVLKRDIFVESPLVHPSVMVRRRAFECAGEYIDGFWPEDYQLWLRMWLKGLNMAKVNQNLFYWRDTPKRLTRSDSRCSHEALRELKVSVFLASYFGMGYEEYDKSGNNRYLLPEHKRNLIVWGAGPNGKALVKSLKRRGLIPAYFTDILDARRGQTICGLKVLGIYELPKPDNYFLVTAVGNPYSREEIRSFLKERGWQEGRDFCCLAGISD